MDMWNI